MKYMGDSKFWNEKFRLRLNKPLQPERSIVERENILSGKMVLDVGCGDGRNILFLLEKGYTVAGIDFSIEGLGTFKKFCRGE